MHSRTRACSTSESANETHRPPVHPAFGIAGDLEVPSQIRARQHSKTMHTRRAQSPIRARYRRGEARIWVAALQSLSAHPAHPKTRPGEKVQVQGRSVPRAGNARNTK